MMRTTLFVLVAGATVAGIAVASPSAPPIGATCDVEGLVSQVRDGLGSGSPAYKKYLQRLLREKAPMLPVSELRAAFAAERDPEMLEQLAAALAARTDRTGEPDGLRAVADRTTGGDWKSRVAATRALRGTSALEHEPELYERLVRDPSPEVRREAAQNLIVDNDKVYGGAHGPAADAAVTAALASTDPAVTASVLANVSMSAISGDSAAGIRRLLASPSAEVRSAAATALGGVPAAEAAAARKALLGLYRTERDAATRIAILRSIARLGFAAAVPDLESLRDVDPSLSIEIDEWVRVLRLGLQEWSLILREKQLAEQARK